MSVNVHRYIIARLLADQYETSPPRPSRSAKPASASGGDSDDSKMRSNRHHVLCLDRADPAQQERQTLASTVAAGPVMSA